MNTRVLYLLLMVLFLYGCHKEYRYPEDPKKTHKSPNARLSGGAKWKITDYTLNGVNIIPELNKLSNTQCSIEDIILTYRYDDYYQYWLLDIRGCFSYPYVGRSGFDDFHYLRIGPDIVPSFNKWFITPFKYVPGSIAYWQVTKLYDNDLHLLLKTDTGEYKIFLRK